MTHGTFPNRNNPHSISTQDVSACVSANPQKGTKATDSYPFFPRCLYGTDITRIR
tara:strand:- start:760 stop:924 length:165 start_codon:yes stop_codon:yes gene_type:complete